MRTRSCLSIAIVVGFLPVFNSVGQAGDWPQILGPNRNGVAEREQLASRWPAAGPRTVWQIPVGRGYAGVAVAAGKVVVFDRQDNQEVVTIRNAMTGKEVWSAKTPVRYESSIASDDGP